MTASTQPDPAPSAGGPDPVAMTRAQRRKWVSASYRGIVLAWSLWLLGSWCFVLTSDSLTRATRWMMFSALFGLMVVWPLIRLSQSLPVLRRASGAGQDATPGGEDAIPGAPGSTPGPTGPTPGMLLADWCSLILVFQAVLWPLRFMTGWSLNQTIALAGLVAGWSLLAGLLAALGCLGGRAIWRSLAMAGCLALLIGEPLAMVVAGLVQPGAAWTLTITPVQMLWALTMPAYEVKLEPWLAPLISVLVAAALGWALLLLWRRVARRSI